MKKIISLILCLVLALSLVACGASEPAPETPETPVVENNTPETPRNPV